MNIEKFGQIDGQDVFELTLALPSGFSAKVLTWGAVLRDLVVPVKGKFQTVVLGLNSLEHYLAHSPSFGATPGRFANRIGDASFEIDGKKFLVTPNKNSRHCLHGGPMGFGKRVWSAGEVTSSSVALHLDSEDGDMGFPGHAKITCIYRLLPPMTLQIELFAETDAPTPINLTHHSYFNLDGSADARDHHVLMNAPFYTPTDEDLIPTGEVRPVAGGTYNFNRARAVRNADGVVYDSNFVVSAPIDVQCGMAHQVTLHSPKNGLNMEVHSNQPGVQFYDGAKVNVPVAGLNGEKYGAHAGLCFEPQNFPDAPNKRHFPNSILRKGERYSHKMEYRFR